MNNKILAIQWLLEGKRIRCVEWKKHWYIRLVGKHLVDDCDKVVDLRMSDFLDYKWELYKDDRTEYYYNAEEENIKTVNIPDEEEDNDDFIEYEYGNDKYDDNFYYDDKEEDEFDSYYDDDDNEYYNDTDEWYNDEDDDNDWW